MKISAPLLKDMNRVWAVFSPPADPHRNFSTVDGIISVDINADCLAWSNLDAAGKRIDGGTIPMPLVGCSTHQAADVIGRAVHLLITECELACKPLAMENLNPKTMRRKQRYGNKKRNRIVSQFAANRIVQIIQSRAERASVGIFVVNPAYTSFIGKTCFMRSMGISVHESASYVIGLLALGFLPEVPEHLKSLLPKKKPSKSKKPLSEKDIFYRNWKSVYTALTGIRTHAFYLPVPELKNASSYKKWFRDHDILHPERAALSATGG